MRLVVSFGRCRRPGPRRPGLAQKPKATVVNAWVGLPPGAPLAASEGGRPGPVAKFAAWAPLSVEILVHDEIKGAAELVVESPDGDEITTSLTVPLPALAAARPGETIRTRDLGVMPYVRPSAGSADTVVRVRAAGGGDLSEPFRIRGLFPSSPRRYVVLSLGNKLPGFDLPKNAVAAETARRGRGARRDGGRHRRRRPAGQVVRLRRRGPGGARHGDRAGRLPPPALRRAGGGRRQGPCAALLEWVRRGGRLVVSGGGNANLLAQFPAFRELAPYAFAADPARAVPTLAFRWSAAGSDRSWRRWPPAAAACRSPTSFPSRTARPACC